MMKRKAPQSTTRRRPQIRGTQQISPSSGGWQFFSASTDPDQHFKGWDRVSSRQRARSHAIEMLQICHALGCSSNNAVHHTLLRSCGIFNDLTAQIISARNTMQYFTSPKTKRNRTQDPDFMLYSQLCFMTIFHQRPMRHIWGKDSRLLPA